MGRVISDLAPPPMPIRRRRRRELAVLLAVAGLTGAALIALAIALDDFIIG